jgi:hypothetical protein
VSETIIVVFEVQINVKEKNSQNFKLKKKKGFFAKMDLIIPSETKLHEESYK